MTELTNEIKKIVTMYHNALTTVDSDALNDNSRAYGGHIRSVKGTLQENITHKIIEIAWADLGGDKERLEINSNKHEIPIRDEYISSIKNEEVRQHLLNNKSAYCYKLSVDKQILIDAQFVIGIECKSYTENAMLKRILMDFSLLKTIYPDISCYLFQLESQLGGDYSELRDITYGSAPTHTLISYSQVNLNIVTFLKGERNIKKPIHKPLYFKPLREREILAAVRLLQKDLTSYL